MNRLYFLLFALPGTLFSNEPDDSRLLTGIEMGIAGRYSEAILHFSKVKEEYPDHPAGHFFLAAIYQSRMMDFETDLWRDQFFFEVNEAETLAREKIDREGDDASHYFYLGGALAYKSFQLGREGDYLPALSSAVKSIGYLNKAGELDSTFCDAYLGIGSYQYWKSKITMRLTWLPFFSDKRSAGINNIEEAVECSRFSKWAALSNLAWIYIEEGDYRQAIHYAEIGLASFPASRFFLWPLGDALFRNKEFRRAAEVYQALLQSVQTEQFNNGYNEVLLRFKLAECSKAMADSELMLFHISRGLQVKGHEPVRGRIAKIHKKLKKLVEEMGKG